MAVEPNDALFVSKLSAASLQKAKEELNELNDADRALAVQTLRQWVIQQDWLKSLTDFGFLLKFLRVRKFSQLEARNTLENYWTCRTTVPQWFKNVDPADPDILKVLKSGCYTCPKRYDGQGCRITTFRIAPVVEFLHNGMSSDTIHKAIYMIWEWIQLDENVQVNGRITFFDCCGVTVLAFKAMYGDKKAAQFAKAMEKAMPSRIKGVYMYREPTFFDFIWAVFSPLFSEKIKSRFHLCGQSLPEVYKYVDQSLLPREYLPDDYKGPDVETIQERADKMIEEMMRPEFRDYIRALSSGQYGVDLDKQSQCPEMPKESFRKINVD